MCSCSKKEEALQWEYKVIRMADSGLVDNKMVDFQPITFHKPIVENTLNKWGAQGYELVSVYTETETVFPNFGNEDYHTGIKTNTRTKAVCFVFKRLKTDASAES